MAQSDIAQPAPPEPAGGSPALREASLRSEERRCYVVIGVILLVMLMLMRRAMRDLDYRLKFAGLAGISVLLAVQFCTLAFAKWAKRRGRGLPDWFVIPTVVIESLVPTGMIVFNASVGALAPYASMNSPPVLAYGLMITLTTLRLRPALCVLAGVICSTSYLGVLAYATYAMNIDVPTTGLPRNSYVNSAILILISGLAGAWVAREIRGHVEAALREAETRRQMERIERDLAVARSIQRGLLPQAAPNVPGFDIAGWNQPADHTGGDYYDWQKLPDGNWIVTLADVSGHGVGPALVTAACRAYVRASGDHHGDLSSLTSRINRLLADDLPAGRFVTMVSVLIDARGGPLALLSAGHGPIVLYLGSTGSVRDILPRDLPLAIERDSSFGPAQAIDMAYGDVLALVTDGFVEWARSEGTSRGEEFGIERLRESLRRNAHRSAAAMIESIRADVTAFAGPTPQQDDLTIVIIRRE